MKAVPFLILVGLLLSCCFRLQQTDIKGGVGYDDFGWFDEQSYGLLTIGLSNAANSIKMIDAKSYAIASDGTRYNVRSSPHEFDVTQKAAYVRDEITFWDGKGTKVRHLGNGDWRFVFCFLRDGKERTAQFGGKLWTYNYIPVIDGPPN